MKILTKLHYNSPVILTYTILSFFVLILGEITGGYTTLKIFCVYQSSFLNPLTYIRVFTHILGHSDFNHFLNNFTIILLIGPILEEKYGSRNLLIIILITAFITGFIQMVLFEEGLLGASGIAFMLISLSSITNIQKGKISITSILILIIYVGKEIFYGIIYKDGISQSTHIIGGICGIILGVLVNKYIKGDRNYAKTRY